MRRLHNVYIYFFEYIFFVNEFYVIVYVYFAYFALTSEYHPMVFLNLL